MEYFQITPVIEWSCSEACKHYRVGNEDIGIILTKIKKDLNYLLNKNSLDIFQRKGVSDILGNWKVRNKEDSYNPEKCTPLTFKFL